MGRKRKAEVIEEVRPPLTKAETRTKLNELCKLHSGQQLAWEAVFKHKKKRVFLQCGRNWGKSLFMARSAVEFALNRANSRCYIIFPEKTQGFEVLWASGVLKGMVPAERLAKRSATRDASIKTEMRIVLDNGSFVKILGADDPDSLRGIKPHFVGYDEYRDFKQAVYWGMEANLLGNDAYLVIGSTPPDVTGHYSELRDYFISESRAAGSMYYYMEMPTETNPYINKETLVAIRKRLFAHGQMRVWEREYMAKFIPGGASAIFPMFADRKDEIVRPHMLVEQLVRNAKSHGEFYAMFDPASSSVFAVLFGMVDRYASQAIFMDEIYEKDRKRTGSLDVWKRAAGVKREYLADMNRWENVYDEHESWFYRDLERYDALGVNESISSTNKQSRNKEEDLSIIKDLMLAPNRLIISDKCVNLIAEIESYCTDKDGRFIKKKDHQIDNARYFVAASGFTINEEPDYDAYLSKIREPGSKEAPGIERWLRDRQREQSWEEEIDEVGLLNDDVIYLEDISYAGF